MSTPVPPNPFARPGLPPSPVPAMSAPLTSWPGTWSGPPGPPPHHPPAPPEPAGPPPSTVVAAWWLVLAGLVSEVAYEISFVLRYREYAGLGSVTTSIVWAVLSAGVLGGLALGLRRRRHGCRVALTVIGVMWLVLSAVSGMGEVVETIASGLQILLVAATLVLLYLPESSAWFARVEPAAFAAHPARTNTDLRVATARRRGQQALGLVLGAGLPMWFVWAFCLLWGRSDGCVLPNDPDLICGGFGLLVMWAPLLSTLLASAAIVVGTVLARSRPVIARRWVVAGLIGWVALGLCCLAAGFRL